LQFKNNLLQQLCELHKIELHYASTHHSNSLGLLNKCHSTLAELLRVIQKEIQSNKFIDNLQLAIIAYNNTLNQNLKLTPNEITFGNIKPNEFKTSNPLFTVITNSPTCL
ncbi:hypothetical protein ACUWCL_28200, partial [Klebsiella pneumoniae]|uniref:hypothetical protein n=1 Tax=Klebsiella pneumoniae TaxID=573 RepID=UPI0040553F55